MRACNIKVSGIHFTNVLKCTIQKSLNKHGRAEIVGIIQEEDEDSCFAQAESENYLEVYAIDENKSKTCIFVGMVEEMEIDTTDVKILTLSLITGSRNLDLKKRTRTFQNAGMTVKQVLQSNEKLNSDVQAQSVFLEDGNNAIGHLIVQYKETDWDFAIRMASNNNTFIRPAFTNKGAKYFFGLDMGQAAKEKPSDMHHYKITKAVDDYEKKVKADTNGLTKKDAFYYSFDSREIYELGDCIQLNGGKPLYILNVESKFHGEELMNTYTLTTRNGFKHPIKYNMKLIGASLGGTVKSAQRDTIQVNLEVDRQYADHGVKEFSYSTVYSSPDGTGWYCMPESGDTIRIYFPTEKEQDAYAISAVHLEVSQGSAPETSDSDFPPARTDPSYKSFKNSANKEILFTPSCISITNPAVGSIVLDDESGITITSSESICIKAEKFIEIHSMQEDITVTADAALAFYQGNTGLVLNEDVIMKGARLKLQEKA
ncbi:hypothetical protein [Anaeromicropila populeti]|uniref:Phage late control gene D protein (GPD) n=1 Tax=Anaeromicropila populeti TaxID=37658 RepID=A0A1I6IMJ3_9FIRM|nr:hypothetical protein [Anaeromicropila populeti]SFR67938.1 hypothetical protein SAMN05661086_00907 [Anaeromicropila populeti]